MERKGTKDKVFTWISILIIFIFLVTSFFFFKYSYSLDKEYKSIVKSYETKVKLNDDEKSKGYKLKQEISNLNNLQNNIDELKKEYFASIKKLEDNIIAGKINQKIAYLTFDDGPYYKTYEFLDVLDKYDVKATFFTIGLGKEKCLDKRSVSCYPVYSEIVKRGHTIANHTYSHLIWNGLYSSPESFIEQIKKQQELINKETGVVTNIARFPGGTRTAGSKKEGIMNLLRKNGYGWVDWTAQDGDGGTLNSKEEALTNFKKSIDQNIEVVLFHDYNDITLSILPEAIEYLRSNGYILLPLFYESNMVSK